MKRLNVRSREPIHKQEFFTFIQLLALHIAAGSQMTQCVKALLQSGADICMDEKGNRPSDMTNRKEILDLLEPT